MLYEELLTYLKEKESDIQAIQAFWQRSQREQHYTKLYEQVHAENFWQHPDQVDILKSFQHVKDNRDAYIHIIDKYNETCELVELFADNEQELQKIKSDVMALMRAITQFKIALLLHKETDLASCFLSINAGAGGTESQDWASILLRMYTRFCEREHIKTTIVDYQPGDEAGIKSATLFLEKKNAYGLLKSESGIHRLVRISPFDASKRRHTSFAAVLVTPEVADEKIEINPDDLRIDTYRAGGKGGQHVNKTDSAVRITHLPTNIVVQCQNERSQLQNKQTALKVLMSRLTERQEEEKRAQAASVEKKKIEWGSQIRSYVLHPYKMVKDHRTGYESPQPDLVLDGDLMPFIEKYLTDVESTT